jgi:PKD repeat protein
VGQPGTTLPFYYYQHTAESRGGAITGSVFVPNGLWPKKYKYLFIDYIYDEMYNLIEDDNAACPSCVPPLPRFRNETFHKHNSMVDMFFGPYKNTRALYVVSRSQGQNIRRIRYTGSSNQAPTAKIVASSTKVLRNEVVMFDGRSSSDPDGDALTYLWDFGDGTTSTSSTPNKGYPKFGQYEVTLTVKDSLDQTSQTFVTIVVGTLPKAFMESPAIGKKFFVGEVIRLKGNATDSRGNPIPSNQIFWEVRQHHATHFHPFLDKIPGNNFNLYPAPAPEELAAAGNSYLEVIMSAVDTFGVTKTISRNVMPIKVNLDIFSNPPGLDILVNEGPIRTPGTILTWQNQVIRLDVKNQKGYVFNNWNILGLRERTYTIKAPTGARRNITAFMKLP